jgi:hypothetical protein
MPLKYDGTVHSLSHTYYGSTEYDVKNVWFLTHTSICRQSSVWYNFRPITSVRVLVIVVDDDFRDFSLSLFCVRV